MSALVTLSSSTVMAPASDTANSTGAPLRVSLTGAPLRVSMRMGAGGAICWWGGWEQLQSLWTGATVAAAAVTVAVEGNRTMSMMWTMPLLAAMSALVTLADGTCVRYGQIDGGAIEGLFDGGAVEGLDGYR